MAEPITLAEAKIHLRVVHTDEDALIAACLSAARNHCEHELGVTITDAGLTLPDATTAPMPDVVRSAILIMLGFLFEKRDADATEVPGAVAALLNLCPQRWRKGAA